jgi:hypothetical protein
LDKTPEEPPAESPPSFESPFMAQPGQTAESGTSFDPSNPYASPFYFGEETKAGGGPELRHRRIDFGDILSTTWGVFTGNVGPCVLVGLVILGFLFGLGIVGQVGGIAAQATGEIEAVVAFQAFDTVLRFFIQTWLNVGVLYFGLKMVRTGQATVGDFFSIGRYYLRTLMLGLLVALICGLVAVVCLAPCGGLALYFYTNGGQAALENNIPLLVASGGIGLVVTVFLCVWITLRVFLATAFILDRDLGVLEAMGSSDTYMRGNKLTTFAVGLIVGLLGVLFMCVTCSIGSIFFYPYTGILGAVIYLTATGQPFPRPNP